MNLKPQSWINTSRLREVAEEVNLSEKEYREIVTRILEEGADLGCRGPGRLGTRMRNSPSAYKYGDRLLDSLVDVLQDGLACGPLTVDEVEKEFGLNNITVNPIAIRLKPNGKARIIIDMSSPHLSKAELAAKTCQYVVGMAEEGSPEIRLTSSSRSTSAVLTGGMAPHPRTGGSDSSPRPRAAWR